MGEFYDLDAARNDVDETGKRKLSDEEILEYLRQLHPSYDTQQALDGGVPVGELLEFLSEREPDDISGLPGDPLAVRAVAAGGRGFSTGLANLIGSPVSLVNAGLRGAELVPNLFAGEGRVPPEAVPRTLSSDKPFLGMRFNREAFNAYGEGLADIEGLIKGQDLDARYDFTYDRVEDLPPDERPFAIGGEVMGGSVIPAAAPLTAARALPVGQKFTGLFAPILEQASTKPGVSAAIEAASAGGAAQAGAIAQVADPDNPITRTYAEIVGGFAAPAAVAARLVGGPVSAVGRAVASTTPEGAKQIAAQRVADMIRESGSNPEAIATLLRERTAELQSQGLPLPSAGQLSENDVLLGIEANLGRNNEGFQLRRNRQAQETLQALRTTAETLESTGDPMALQTAARLRDQYFKDAVQTEVDNALTEAQRIYAQVFGESGLGDDALPEASTQAVAALRTSLGSLRKVEDQLWSQVPEVPVVKSDNLQSVVRNITDTRMSVDALRRMLRIEDMPEHMQPGFKALLDDVSNASGGGGASLTVDDVIGAFTAGGDDSLGASLANLIGQNTADQVSNIYNISSTDLIRLRSRARQIADDAFQGADPDRQLGAVARMIEMAAGEDLNAIGATGGYDTAFKTAFDDARRLSREIHAIFNQTFAGKAFALNSANAERIPPEMFLQTAFGGRSGGTQTGLNIRQILRAGGSHRGDNYTPDQIAAMGGANPTISTETGVRKLVQVMSREAGFDPKSPGRLNVNKLNTFISRNRSLLENVVDSRGQPLFGDILEGFTDATAAEARVQQALSEQTDINKATAQSEYLSSLLDGQDPWKVVSNAMRSGNPQNAFLNLAETAAYGGPEAEAGLRTAVMDYAFNRASEGLSVDTPAGLQQFWRRLDYNLRGQPRRGQPSLLNMMTTSYDPDGNIVNMGVMDQAQADRLNLILDRANGVSRALARGEELSVDLGPESMLTDLLTRAAGARFGASLAGNYAGAPLVAAGAGSRFAQRIMTKMPIGKVRDVLMEASANPELMAALLERPTSVRQARDLARQINSQLIAAGVLSTDEWDTSDSASGVGEEYLEDLEND